VNRESLDLFLTESDVMQVCASTHIMAPFREDLEKCGFIKSTTLKWKSHESLIKTAGRVIIIHTPPTKSGKRVLFLTLEDEDGLFDLTVFEGVHAQYAKKILASTVLLVEGVLNRFGLRGVSIVAKRFWTLREFYETSLPVSPFARLPVPEPAQLANGLNRPTIEPSNTSRLPLKHYDLNELQKTRHAKGRHGLLDRQDPDQKRHLLPEASNYRGRPA
jgi:error-prone DNA polymerase